MPDLPEEAVEDFARRRWNARRQEIIESGTAADPGRSWDEIEPLQSGRDVRAAARQAARRDLVFAAPAIRHQRDEELRERLTSDEAVRAAERGLNSVNAGYIALGHPHGERMQKALEAAFDSIVEEAEDE